MRARTRTQTLALGRQVDEAGIVRHFEEPLLRPTKIRVYACTDAACSMLRLVTAIYSAS